MEDIFKIAFRNITCVTSSRLVKKQLCYMLARQYVPLELDDEDLRTILLNAHINDHFLSLAREVIFSLNYINFS